MYFRLSSTLYWGIDMGRRLPDRSTHTTEARHARTGDIQRDSWTGLDLGQTKRPDRDELRRTVS